MADTTQAFTRSMQQALTDAGLTSGSIGINYYTAPADTAPASIEGTYDSVISAAAVLNDLKGRWDDWDGVRLDSTACASGAAHNMHMHPTAQHTY